MLSATCGSSSTSKMDDVNSSAPNSDWLRTCRAVCFRSISATVTQWLSAKNGARLSVGVSNHALTGWLERFESDGRFCTLPSPAGRGLVLSQRDKTHLLTPIDFLKML